VPAIESEGDGRLRGTSVFAPDAQSYSDDSSRLRGCAHKQTPSRVSGEMINGRQAEWYQPKVRTYYIGQDSHDFTQKNVVVMSG
jgi:hypothetical protein